MKLWSFDVRSGGPNHATLLERIRASLEGPLGVVQTVIQKVQRSIRVVLSIGDGVEACLGQRQAKQLALAWTLFDQADGGGVSPYI